MGKLSMDGFLRSVKLIPGKDDDHYDDYDDYDDEYDEFEDEEEAAPALKKSIKTSRFSKAETSDYDEFDDDEGEETGSIYSAPARSQKSFVKAVNTQSHAEPKKQNVSEIRPVHKEEEGEAVINVRIMHPKTVEDANSIADELLSDKIVVMNLEEVDMAAAQRIVDFVSGACYSLDGNLQKIAKKAFIVTPKNANLSSEIGNLIGEAVGLNSVNIMK